MTRPANDNSKFLAVDVAALEAAFADMLASFPELAEDEQLRADTIEGETNAYEILARLINQEREADSMAKAIAGRVSDLQGRKSRQERKKDAMRGLMFKLLKAANLPRVTLPEATVSISKKAAGVEIVDEEALPDMYVRIKREPDNTAIKAALAAGDKVLGAKLGEAGETLTVRAA